MLSLSQVSLDWLANKYSHGEFVQDLERKEKFHFSSSFSFLTSSSSLKTETNSLFEK